MNRNEVVMLLQMLYTAYPKFAEGQTKQGKLNMVNLWEDMFRDEDASVVGVALRKLLAECVYVPTIAELKTKIKEVKQAVTGEKTDEELWTILRKAISNGHYGYMDEYKRLPKILQMYCGSPRYLYENSQTDEQTLDTVTHALFLKSIGNIRKREEYAASLPDDVKAMLTGKFVDREQDFISPEERKNQITGQLRQLEDKRRAEERDEALARLQALVDKLEDEANNERNESDD